MFENVKDYYPTPSALIRKMLDKLDFKQISSILEPSAGSGHLVEAIIEKFKYSRSYYYSKEAVWDVDLVEINEELQMILKGKGHRVVADDFLTYNTYKSYDSIIANFPFSDGEKHLMKALEMQENGGSIVCLINAESLKNPYSNIRKELLDKLEHYKCRN